MSGDEKCAQNTRTGVKLERRRRHSLFKKLLLPGIRPKVNGKRVVSCMPLFLQISEERFAFSGIFRFLPHLFQYGSGHWTKHLLSQNWHEDNWRISHRDV